LVSHRTMFHVARLLHPLYSLICPPSRLKQSQSYPSRLPRQSAHPCKQTDRRCSRSQEPHRAVPELRPCPCTTCSPSWQTTECASAPTFLRVFSPHPNPAPVFGIRGRRGGEGGKASPSPLQYSVGHRFHLVVTAAIGLTFSPQHDLRDLFGSLPSLDIVILRQGIEVAVRSKDRDFCADPLSCGLRRIVGFAELDGHRPSVLVRDCPSRVACVETHASVLSAGLPR